LRTSPLYALYRLDILDIPDILFGQWRIPLATPDANCVKVKKEETAKGHFLVDRPIGSWPRPLDFPPRFLLVSCSCGSAEVKKKPRGEIQRSRPRADWAIDKKMPLRECRECRECQVYRERREEKSSNCVKVKKEETAKGHCFYSIKRVSCSCGSAEVKKKPRGEIQRSRPRADWAGMSRMSSL
jgi:hypothetical protein